MSKETQSKKKHAGGRPTKYDPKYIKEVADYIADCKSKDVLPLYEDLKLMFGVHEDTIYEWAKQHKEFSESLGSVKSLQKTMLIRHGLEGKYNAQIAKLVLSVNHKMVETNRSELTGKDGEVLNINIVKYD